MKKISAISVVLLAGIMAGNGAAGGGTGATGAYQLTAQLPATIAKGKVTTLILHIRENGKPVDSVAACLTTAPLFMSVEDALDTTPAGGIDLGTGLEAAAQPGCRMGMAGVPSGPGTYEFTWEPDTAGHVNLIFTAGVSMLNIPVDVASTPPSRAILILFFFVVAAVLSTAACLRRRLRPEGAAS
jgi:hypothetical protein